VTAGRVFESRHLQDLGVPHADVDVVDGLFLALAPPAFERLSVDEGLAFFHGYDIDLCLQARQSGLRVVSSVRLTFCIAPRAGSATKSLSPRQTTG